MRYLLAICCLCLLLLTGCAVPGSQAAAANGTLYGLSFTRTAFNFGAWPAEGNLFYNAGYSLTSGDRDAYGVRMYKSSSGTLYQHPVLQAQDGLQALQSYQHMKKANLLAQAELEAKRLIDTHMTQAFTGAAWWFPYPFSFAEYGEVANTARAPWFSGMAQGEALCLFTQLYEVTHDAKWKDAADHAFLSFHYPLKANEQSNEHPWVWHVDSGGWLWIEEYPTPNTNDHTMNGFGFATYGLMEYARAFRDGDAHLLAEGALTTFAHAAALARHPGGVSSYSLSHPADRLSAYHIIVTTQLTLFAVVTGNGELSTLAHQFYLDYHDYH